MKHCDYIIAMARTANPNTEKLTRQVMFMLQPSLFAEFEGKCRVRYRTVSEVLRGLILEFVREDGDATEAGFEDGRGKESR